MKKILRSSKQTVASRLARFSPIQRQLILSGTILLLLMLLTSLVVMYGNGYRIGLSQNGPKIARTGILNAQSTPRGAQVYIDDHLTSATNNAINLTPGKHTVRIEKDGYAGWRKDVMIKQEEVTNAEATLFPLAPSLQSISTFGIQDPVVDPSGNKIAFKITGQNSLKNGVYVLDMTGRTFPVLVGQSSSTQLVNDTSDVFSTAHLSWSPDGAQLLASVSGTFRNPTYYVLNARSFNDLPQDVTATLTTLQETWEQLRITKEQARLTSLKPKLQKLISENFTILSWSPDENKILYQASESAQLPLILEPRRIGNNLLYERRDLEKGSIYVYNILEDVNTRVVEYKDPVCAVYDTTCREHPFRWLPDSTHVIYVHEKKINIVEDDGANMTTIYAGPFLDSHVFPWPDQSKLVILTNLGNETIPPTLYTISLK